MAIFPANKASLVQELIDMTYDKPDPNKPIRIEFAREDSGKPELKALFVITRLRFVVLPHCWCYNPTKQLFNCFQNWHSVVFFVAHACPVESN